MNQSTALITRRALLVAPAALVVVPTPIRANPSLILGDVIIWLFEKVVEIGIGLLLESAIRHIRQQYLEPNQRQGQTQRSPQSTYTQNYIERGRAADNFCPYWTVEYATKGQKFWNGAFFEPNEKNKFYRGFNRPTDQVLLQILTESESLRYLDLGRNRNAHIPTSIVDGVRNLVSRLEADKPRLYSEIQKHTLRAGHLDQYLVPREMLKEIDRQYTHVTEEYHIDQKYVDAVVELQRFVTWYNMKLIAIQGAALNGDELIA